MHIPYTKASCMAPPGCGGAGTCRGHVGFGASATASGCLLNAESVLLFNAINNNLHLCRAHYKHSLGVLWGYYLILVPTSPVNRHPWDPGN